MQTVFNLPKAGERRVVKYSEHFTVQVWHDMRWQSCLWVTDDCGEWIITDMPLDKPPGCVWHADSKDHAFDSALYPARLLSLPHYYTCECRACVSRGDGI